MACIHRPIGVLSLLIVSILLAPNLAIAAAGTIEAIGGIDKIKVNRSGKAVFLKQGDTLELDDQITTDKLTAVDVRLEDQSIVRVGINSSYKIEKDSVSGSILHRLIDGIVRVLVPKRVDGTKQKDVRFKMQTPEGTIGVRGTEFVVIHSAANTMLKGLSGDVLFGASGADLLDESKIEHIKKGFQSSVALGASRPTKPVEFDADVYQNQLNSAGSGSPFGPLSGRVAGAVISRASTAPGLSAANASGASSASAAAISALKPPSETPKAPVDGKKVGSKLDPNTALIVAMDEVNKDKLARAIKQGAEINKKDKDGDSPLHFAVANLKDKERDQVFVQAMIVFGAKVDMKNKDGETPLMIVARHSGSVMIAKALVANGADIDEKNAAGKTAFDIAEEKGSKELAAYLKCHMSGGENCE